MNISKLESLIDGKKMTKAKLIKATGISRPALDSILSGNDFKVSNLEKIVRALDIKIGFLFDEVDDVQPARILQTEGDYSPASDSGDVSVVVGDAVLAEQIRSLKALMAEKDARIRELKERIDELKTKKK